MAAGVVGRLEGNFPHSSPVQATSTSGLRVQRKPDAGVQQALDELQGLDQENEDIDPEAPGLDEEDEAIEPEAEADLADLDDEDV
jgi:hypothetical protein